MRVEFSVPFIYFLKYVSVYSLFPTSSEPFLSYILEIITLFQQQRSNTHPVVVHCSSGIGRSGLVCLLTTAIFDLTNNANSIPDLAALTLKLTNCRKNILRDREHLKFAYECLLTYMRQVVTQGKVLIILLLIDHSSNFYYLYFEP